MTGLEGKVAIVTGGALGIGRGAVLAFAESGAQVVIADVNEEAGRQTAADAKDLGSGGLFVPADVARAADCQRVVAESVSTFGRVDVLGNSSVAFNNI